MTWAKRAQDLAEQLMSPKSHFGLADGRLGGVSSSAADRRSRQLAKEAELAREVGRGDLVALTYVIIARTAGQLHEYDDLGTICARRVRLLQHAQLRRLAPLPTQHTTRDLLADCAVTTEGFAAMADAVAGACPSLSAPVGGVLEGGYALGALGR